MFSCTLIDRKTCRPSGTCAMPNRARSEGEQRLRSAPLNAIVPEYSAIPEMALNRVDFPAPFAPMSAMKE